MTDLKDLTPKSDTVVVTLKHPSTGTILGNEDGSPMTITLHAPHTKSYKKVMYGKTQDRIEKIKETGDKKIDFDELEDITLSTLAEVTTEWNITYDGKKPTLSVKKAIEIYNEVFWIRNQIEEAISDNVDFTKD